MVHIEKKFKIQIYIFIIEFKEHNYFFKYFIMLIFTYIGLVKLVYPWNSTEIGLAQNFHILSYSYSQINILVIWYTLLTAYNPEINDRQCLIWRLTVDCV